MVTNKIAALHTVTLGAIALREWWPHGHHSKTIFDFDASKRLNEHHKSYLAWKNPPLTCPAILDSDTVLKNAEGPNTAGMVLTGGRIDPAALAAKLSLQFVLYISAAIKCFLWPEEHPQLKPDTVDDLFMDCLFM